MKISTEILFKIHDILEQVYTTSEFDGCIKYENDKFEIITQGKQFVVTDKRSMYNVVYNDIDTAYDKIKGRRP